MQKKNLNLEIETIACPADADVRQAKISTILEAGDSSIDIFSVNDEMISEFKYKDYLKTIERYGDDERTVIQLSGKLYAECTDERW